MVALRWITTGRGLGAAAPVRTAYTEIDVSLASVATTAMREPSGDQAGNPNATPVPSERTVDRPVESTTESDPVGPSAAIEPGMAAAEGAAADAPARSVPAG